MQYFTLISAFNFLVFALVLLTKTSPIKKANTVLGIIFILMMLYDLTMCFLYVGFRLQSDLFLSWYVPVDCVFCGCFGPAIFYYIDVVFSEEKPLLSRKYLLHSLTIAPLVAFPAWFATLEESARITHLKSNILGASIEESVANMYFYVQMTTYLFICYFRVNKHLKESKTVVVNNFVVDIGWLKAYFIIDIAIMLLSAPICIIVGNDYLNAIIGQIAINVQFAYIFVMSVWQTGVFTDPKLNVPRQPADVVEPVEQEPDADVNPEPPLTSPSYSNLSDERATEYMKTLDDYFEKEKPYFTQNCTINMVSNETGIPVHYISYIVNAKMERNFFDFINDFRVEKAKRLLLDTSNQFTVEAIGTECGFGSKSSFYKAFKKVTNQTPLEFRTNSRPSV